jgi:tRNA1Val (adenine37-N6)-methyltransferase
MKVCTDACLFGSMLPTFGGKEEKITDVLDIGTGTGLLSLMYAQKNSDAIIDAVEIEEKASEQAKENFESSPWKERLKVFHTDVKALAPTKKYDLIICNPPFYENDLLSNEKNKNIAKHDQGLTLKELINIIPANLADTGTFAVLLPFHRVEYVEHLAEENKIFLKEKILVRQTPAHNFFRGILFFSKTQSSSAATKTPELTIKDKEGNYTAAFTDLLKDYYLQL